MYMSVFTRIFYYLGHPGWEVQDGHPYKGQEKKAEMVLSCRNCWKLILSTLNLIEFKFITFTEKRQNVQALGPAISLF